ncbi:hypothetical protein [Azospirillum halopraeferens]|uniref:hypothetical protein n=1 Tax=Azospirillum halopraeferens TaxID=34010 RepID=UPI0003FB78F3|nr:hypothetical protein [Azospirillum halopraeferens]
MTTSTSADGSSDGSDLTGRLTRITNRTNLMVIDATLSAVPQDAAGYATAAAEVQALARRMARAVNDFAETIEIRAEAIEIRHEPAV